MYLLNYLKLSLSCVPSSWAPRRRIRPTPHSQCPPHHASPINSSPLPCCFPQSPPRLPITGSPSFVSRTLPPRSFRPIRPPSLSTHPLSRIQLHIFRLPHQSLRLRLLHHPPCCPTGGPLTAPTTLFPVILMAAGHLSIHEVRRPLHILHIPLNNNPPKQSTFPSPSRALISSLTSSALIFHPTQTHPAPSH